MYMNRIQLLAFALFVLPLSSVVHAQAVMAHPDMPSAQTSRVTAGTYQEYSRAAFDAAKGKQRILFFHATWCPTCKQANADLLSHLAQLPRDVVVFKTDYDREVALKKQYGVLSQHTFVLVDAQGNAVRRWAGGGVRELLAQLRR